MANVSEDFSSPSLSPPCTIAEFLPCTAAKQNVRALIFLTCSEGHKAIWEQEIVFSLPHSPRYSIPHTTPASFCSCTRWKFLQGHKEVTSEVRLHSSDESAMSVKGGTDTKLQLTSAYPEQVCAESNRTLAWGNQNSYLWAASLERILERTACSIPDAQRRHNEMPGPKPRVTKLQSRNITQVFRGGVGSQCNGLSRGRL